MPRVVIKAGCDDDSSKFRTEIHPNYLKHWSTTDYFVLLFKFEDDLSSLVTTNKSTELTIAEVNEIVHRLNEMKTLINTQPTSDMILFYDNKKIVDIAGFGIQNPTERIEEWQKALTSALPRMRRAFQMVLAIGGGGRFSICVSIEN